MQRASLEFWENYLETMLFFKHTVKQCLVSIISQIHKREQLGEQTICKCLLKKGIDPSNLLDSKKEYSGIVLNSLE